MKTKRKLHIVLTVLAALAAAVLFITYGTVLPSFPFARVQLNGPTHVDSDGEFTGVVDTESHRVLILNSDGDLTGVVSCTTIDSPFDVVTDVSVRDGLVYVSGARFDPGKETILKERVATYDKGGNYQGVVFEKDGVGDVPEIKALNDTQKGVTVAYEHAAIQDGVSQENMVSFDLIHEDQVTKVKDVKVGYTPMFDAALADDGNGGYRYATLSVRGILGDGESNYDLKLHVGHEFSAIDLGENGTLYACDDETGSLCAIAKDSSEVRELVSDAGYHRVHYNHGVISLSNTEANKVAHCSASGTITSEFTEVKPSIGYSLRMVAVWASALYLIVLTLVLGSIKLRRQIKEGKTREIGAMLTSVAVVAAVAVAVGNYSYTSYQTMLKQRANEINMCADHLESTAASMSEAMGKLKDRDALRGTEEEFTETATNLFDTAYLALSLVRSAQNNNIGIYCSLYGKDDRGVFYLFGSTTEYVLGSAVRGSKAQELQAAFANDSSVFEGLRQGATLRDVAQYRLVPIPTTDGEGVAGVIEIGGRMHLLRLSAVDNLVPRILMLLVLVLVVYLTYSELHACGECLISYRARAKNNGARAVAVLTRPFTFAITMLTSIDSVMTVLIARDLLTKAGMGESSVLLAVPAVMLGVGMVAGQGLYAITGRRVGLRRLLASGAVLMMLCALFTIAAVNSGIFWLYCAAKLAMAIPFGMLYTMGYSMPRLADNDEDRSFAAGGVKRTDTSAAALGTVLGGFAAQAFGNMWVYVLVAIACLPVYFMAINMLPRGMEPLEKLAQPDSKTGLVRDFLKTAPAIAIALFLVLPATLAAGYTSFLFPLFSSDHGLSKADINNIYVLGQLVVYVCISMIERLEGRKGRWKASLYAIALLGLVFLLFAVNTTLMWSIAVIALVGLLCKTSDGWKAMWLKAAGEAGVSNGRAVSAMFAVRSIALIAQPFIMGALLGATDSIAVIVIGLICAISAALFFLITRRTTLTK